MGMRPNRLPLSSIRQLLVLLNDPEIVEKNIIFVAIVASSGYPVPIAMGLRVPPTPSGKCGLNTWRCCETAGAVARASIKNIKEAESRTQQGIRDIFRELLPVAVSAGHGGAVSWSRHG